MSNLENDFESNGDTHLETSSSTVTTTSDISTNYIDEIQNVINEWIPQFPWDISNDEDNQVVMENGLSGEQEQDIINMKEKSQIEDETIVEKKKFTTNATGGAADDGTDGSTIEASNEVLNDEMPLVTTQQDIFQSSEGPSEVLYQQGALAYASATGDLLFLMTLLSSKLSIRDDSIHKTNSFNEKQDSSSNIESDQAQNMGKKDHPNAYNIQSSSSSSNIHNLKWNAYHDAAYKGDFQLIQVLQFQNRHEINNEDIDAISFKGSTPLCIACERGNFRAAAVLLGFGRGVQSFPKYHNGNNSFKNNSKETSLMSQPEGKAIGLFPYADPNIRRRSDGASPLIISLTRHDPLCTAVIILSYALNNWAYKISMELDNKASNVTDDTNAADNDNAADDTENCNVTSFIDNIDTNDNVTTNDDDEEGGGGELDSRRKGVLRSSEIAALMLTFPARDPPASVFESSSDQLTPLFKINPLTDPKSWRISQWIGMNNDENDDSDENENDNNGSSNGRSNVLLDEDWNEASDDTFYRDFIVNVEVTDNTLYGYLNKYPNILQQQNNNNNNNDDNSMLNISNSVFDGMHTRDSEVMDSSNALIGQFEAAKTMCQLTNIGQMVYLGLLTYIESNGNITAQVAKNAPSAILSSLCDGEDDDDDDEDGEDDYDEDDDSDNVVEQEEEGGGDDNVVELEGNENNDNTFQNNLKHLSSNRLINKKSQKLNGIWKSASLSHDICMLEQENVLLSSQYALTSLKLNKITQRGKKLTRSNSLSSTSTSGSTSSHTMKHFSDKKKLKLFKDSLDVRWLKSAPQIGLLSLPSSQLSLPSIDNNNSNCNSSSININSSSSNSFTLLNVAFKTCRLRCMQALIEKLPFHLRCSYIKALKHQDDDDDKIDNNENSILQTEEEEQEEQEVDNKDLKNGKDNKGEDNNININNTHKSNNEKKKSMKKKDKTSEDCFTYNLRLLAVDSDDCLPFGWKAIDGCLYSTLTSIDEVFLQENTSSGSGNSGGGGSGGSGSGGSGGGNGETFKNKSKNKSNKKSDVKSGNFVAGSNVDSTCPTKDGIKIGALLPLWPENWVKLGPELELAKYETSQLKINSIDAFHTNITHCDEDNEDDDLIRHKHDNIDIDGDVVVDASGGVSGSSGDNGDVSGVGGVSGVVSSGGGGGGGGGESDVDAGICRCMSCGLSLRNIDEASTHICNESDQKEFLNMNENENENKNRNDNEINKKPKVGERVLCFLPDLTNYKQFKIYHHYHKNNSIKSQVMNNDTTNECQNINQEDDIRTNGEDAQGNNFSQNFIQKSSIKKTVVGYPLKGRWYAANIVSFHCEKKENVNLREDLDMFLELMSTQF